MKSSGRQLVLVPVAGQRTLGVVCTLLGVGALVAGARTGSLPASVALGVLALAALALGLDIILTRLVVTPGGVQVRRLLPTQASTAQISAVEARSAPGILGDKVRIEIDRTSGRSIRLTHLERYATPEGLTSTNTDVAVIREILGGVAPERPSF